MINIFKKEFRRELWIMYVTLFALLFINVLNRFILHNNHVAALWYNNEYSSFATLIILTAFSAIVIAIYNFKFLHNSQQIDLEHSLPITRSALFLIKYIKGVLYFAIPYLTVFAILCIMDNLFYPETAILSVELILFSLKYLIIITFVYTVIVFANLISGTSFYSVFISLILLFFLPVFCSFQSGYYETMLIKYYDFNDIVKYYLINDLTNSSYASSNYLTTNYYSVGSYLVTICLFILTLIILVFICLKVYKKRKSEYTETLIAFPKSKTFISIIVIYSFSCLISISFLELNRRPGLGLIFALIIVMLLSFLNNVSVDKGLQKLKLKKYVITTICSGVLMLLTFGVFSLDSYGDISNIEIKAKGIDFAYFRVSSENYYYNEHIIIPTPVDYDLCVELIEELDKQSKIDEFVELNSENTTATLEERNQLILISSRIFASEDGFAENKVWYLDNRNPEDVALLDKLLSYNTEQSLYSTFLNTFENITAVKINNNSVESSRYTEFNEGNRKYPYFTYMKLPKGDDEFRAAFIKDLAEIAQNKATKESTTFDYIPLRLANNKFGAYGNIWVENVTHTNIPITKEWSNTLNLLEVPENNFRVYDIKENTALLKLIDEQIGVYDYINQISVLETYVSDVYNCVSNADFKEYNTEDILNDKIDIHVYTQRITSSNIQSQNLKLILDETNKIAYFGIVE